MPEWGFITNHGLVLAVIAKRPSSTARDIGAEVGITERSAHKIINDLEAEGYVTKTKVGRQNKYRIHAETPLREEVSDAAVGELLVMLGWKRRQKRKSSAETRSSNGEQTSSSQ